MSDKTNEREQRIKKIIKDSIPKNKQNQPCIAKKMINIIKIPKGCREVTIKFTVNSK